MIKATNQQQAEPSKRSEYLKILPSGTRYQRLVALAREYGCSWTKVAYYAIDQFLEKNPPRKV